MTYQPNTPENPEDDIFAPLSKGNAPQGSAGLPPIPGSTEPGYTPPPYTPPQKKGPNTLLLILLGMVIMLICICGACVATLGGSFAAIIGNPTVQAIISEVPNMATTLEAITNLPDKLPADADKAGTIAAGETKSDSMLFVNQQYWQYQGRSGEKITVTVTAASSSLDPLIGVYDGDGGVLKKTSFSARQTNDGKQSLSVDLPNDGTYNILLGGISGKYTITVNSDRNR